jgi:hypothetical protein
MHFATFKMHFAALGWVQFREKGLIRVNFAVE